MVSNRNSVIPCMIHKLCCYIWYSFHLAIIREGSPLQSISPVQDQCMPVFMKGLCDMEQDSRNTFKPDHTLSEFGDRFEKGYIPARRKRYDNAQISIDELIEEVER